MSRIHGLLHILRSLVRPRTADDETREELAYHLARQTEKYVAQGMSVGEARRLAAIELGGAGRWRDETGDARRGSLLRDALGDARYALRGMRARPGFTIAALATLAIGIGASTAIFSVVDGVLISPLPFPNASRVMALSLRMPVQGTRRIIDMSWSYPKYLVLRARQHSFTALAPYSPETLVIDGADGAERMPGEMAGAEYFRILGVRPSAGRGFSADEDRPGGANDVVVLSDALWRDRFGARETAIGETMTIAGRKHRIVGVMPPRFAGLSGDARLWVPVPAARTVTTLESATAHNMQLVGALTDGVTFDAARTEVASLGQRIDGAYPDQMHWGAAAYSLDELRVNSVIRRTLGLLMVAVAMVLAIVCVNLATLLLTRAAGRRQELAIRLALGGGRSRLVRQLVTEAVVLSLGGAIIGLMLSLVATRALAAALPLAVPSTSSGVDLTRLAFSRVHIDVRVLAFTMLLGGAVGASIGLASALRAASSELIASLRQGSASSGLRATGMNGTRGFSTNALVIAQIALAGAFLVGAGLTLQSFARALTIPLGYQPSGLLSARVSLDPIRAQRDSTTALWRGIVDEVRALPGVTDVAVGSCAPIGMRCDGTDVAAMGHAPIHVAYLTASPGYFSSLGTRIVRGRAFDARDETSNEPIVVVNRAAAAAGWGADDPLTLPVELGNRRARVIGVVDDARYGDIERPADPAVFLPFRGDRGVLFVRADGDVQTLGSAIRRAVKRVGAGNALSQIVPMKTTLRDATARGRLSAQVFTVFALSALLLAAIGVYGTLTLRVSQRSRELAIRRALGATGNMVLAFVGREAASIAIAGCLLGALLTIVVARGMSSLLFDVRMGEPMVYAASAGLLLIAVATAAIVPAMRSLRIDPKDAMRSE